MKLKVWGWPTRVFHLLLALGFIGAYFLEDFESIHNLHHALGALVGVLIVFRIIYGLIGPKYSHFRDFPIGVSSQFKFLKSYFSKDKIYTGHNPIAAFVMICILLVGLITSISGYLLYSAGSHAPIIAIDKDILESCHELFSNLFLVLIIIHLIGIIGDAKFHKNGTAISIFTGYKNIDGEPTKTNALHKSFSLIWFVIPFIVFYIFYKMPVYETDNDKDEHSKTEHHEKND